MKLFILSMIAVVSFSSFGNYKWDLERNLKLLSTQVNVLADKNADLLTVEQLKETIRKLKDVKATLMGMDRNYPTLACSQDNVQVFRNVFKSINHFAISSKGPELSEEDAKTFTIDWTNTYPCSYADTYMRTFLNIKIYGYASNGGLDLSNEEAIAYAQEMTPNFCGNFNYKNDFHAAFHLAHYELDLPEKEARIYAKNIIERDYFNCRWDDNIIQNNVDLTNRFNTNNNNLCITPIIIAPVTPNVPSTNGGHHRH